MNRPTLAALVLAAGRSRRMGEPNKLLADLGGKPLVAWAVDAALACRADPVIVVTGHQAAAIAAALEARPIRLAEAPDFAAGLSASLRAGLEAVPPEAEGAIILLGDMPRITAGLIERLIAAFDPAAGRTIVAPTFRGRRGHPVLWGRRFFPEMKNLSGDRGARDLLQINSACLETVAVDDDAVLDDVDRHNDLARLRSRLSRPDR
ncbi:MAG: NTP transferase domain-containing protein [Alphaproteobacteria bacterium]|nr:NTP transferase domain-containing protein [Alphaproteobacteria bacterium]